MTEEISLLTDGTVYSARKNFQPFTSAPLEAYTDILTIERIERLKRTAERLEGIKLLELNATAEGGGVAEMLYSAVPFLNSLGIQVEWKVITGNNEYFECTKGMHNLLQGMPGFFTQEMEQIYLSNLQVCASTGIIDYTPDIVTVHDPQPLCLIQHLKKLGETWFWRCHIDIEEAALSINADLYALITDCVRHYDAAIFSAAHYVVSRWPMPKFIIPPFIDPFSDKNRELSGNEIQGVLAKYNIEPKMPIIVQIGRFDPWKGIDRTIATYRHVSKRRPCQLIIAGGLAADDPEGERILDKLYYDVKDDRDIHILNIPQKNRRLSCTEINALQRAASVIMQPSTKEGFGLVITEALWKGKPVFTAEVGGIPLQIRDGNTGYFYQGPQKTADKINYLLDNPQAAALMGERGKQYVKEHFLLPDRIADYLLAIDMFKNLPQDRTIPSDAIVSFHPWFKLAKRR
jgi:trehalose synthase